jgi:hypothetical protein
MARWTVNGHGPVSLTTKDGQQVHVPLSDLYFDETGIQRGIWANHPVFGTLLTQQLGLLVGQGYLKRGAFLSDDSARKAAQAAVDARRADAEAKAKADAECDAKIAEGDAKIAEGEAKIAQGDAKIAEGDSKPPAPKKAAEPKKTADKEATAVEEAPEKPDSPKVSGEANQADRVIDEVHTEQA